MHGQLGVQQRHPRPPCGRAVGVNRLVFRLRPGELRVGREHRAEGGVHPLRDLRQRAEVLRDRSDARAALRLPLEHPLGAQVGIDVGAPEAVDRLFRIADDEQLARLQRYLVPGARPRAARRRRVVGGEQEHDFGLQRVGILKFVHQKISEPLAQRRAHRRIAGHQRPRLDQQVVEVELAGAPPRRSRAGDERAERRAEAVQGIVVEARAPPEESVAGRLLQLAHARQRFGRAPVAAVAPLRPEGQVMQRRLHQRRPQVTGRGAGKLLHLRQLAPQLAEAAQAGVAIAAAGGGELVALRAQRLQFPQHPVGGGLLRGAAGQPQLAVPVQDFGHFVHRIQRHAQPHAAFHRRQVRSLQVPDPVVPLVPEVDPAGDLVELAKAGVDARFEGKLSQQTGGKGVDGLDVRAHQVAQGRPIAAALRLGGGLQPLVQAVPDPGAQLARRLLGEGDHHHFLDLGGAAANDLHHAVHQNARLAGAGARFQEEAGGQVGGGGRADLLVDRWPAAGG